METIGERAREALGRSHVGADEIGGVKVVFYAIPRRDLDLITDALSRLACLEKALAQVVPKQDPKPQP